VKTQALRADYSDTVDVRASPAIVLTTIVNTKDEELHIGRCIDSVKELGPVIVVDSASTDRTREIAQEHHAAVVEHPWEGYAAQKNWALANLPIETEWVLFLDADETLTRGARDEIRRKVGESAVDGYFIARENIVLGRRLRHAWWYPDYQMRVFRRQRARYEDRLVHEHVIVDGATDVLSQPLIHENLKGINAWMERHIRYARLEAEEMRKSSPDTATGVKPSFRGNQAERRRALKTRVWYRLPMRPAVRFMWMYFVKRGFLDGRAGLAYCELVAAYEALIDANLLELERGAK
jgi:glycosyltransferase involved in cell wall biosynthesis